MWSNNRNVVTIVSHFRKCLKLFQNFHEMQLHPSQWQKLMSMLNLVGIYFLPSTSWQSTEVFSQERSDEYPSDRSGCRIDFVTSSSWWALAGLIYFFCAVLATILLVAIYFWVNCFSNNSLIMIIHKLNTEYNFNAMKIFKIIDECVAWCWIRSSLWHERGVYLKDCFSIQD